MQNIGGVLSDVMSGLKEQAKALQAGGASRRRSAGRAKRRSPRKSPKAAARGGTKASSGTKTKKDIIRDRIKAGAKVHVGERGALYVVFDNKKHSVCN
jgi:hypothetical protein